MSDEIRNFAPSWPAAVMGTGIIPIALSLSSASQPWMKEAATGFFFLSLALLAVVTIVMALRLFIAPAEYAKDLRHPVAGSFLPTLPIAFIIVALDFLSLGGPLFGEALSTTIAAWLFGLGTAGIWIIGSAVLVSLFGSTEVKPGHATFGWFIPPVSQLIVGVGGLELVRHLERGPATDLVFVLALAGLGIGTVLFLFVGATVYGRYVYQDLPAPKMAPTAAIGFAPTAVMVVAMAKLAGAQGAPGFAGSAALLPEHLGLFALALWGFSVFGFVLAFAIIAKGFSAMRAHFGLPWWAMTFPLGALAVSTGSLGKLLGSSLFEPLLVGFTYLLLLVWVVVFLGTLRGIGNLSIFARD